MRIKREIVVDTESTGFDPYEGHRLAEIGCIELHNYIPTGKTYHVYVNPQRDMPEAAFNVHGLSEKFLSDKPLFEHIAQDFLDFVQDSPLVIHNAAFDMRFLNFELKRAGLNELPNQRAIDTLAMARKKYPGAPNSLDALCRRFEIDASSRDKHGALIDAELLAEVYLELIGGRQPGLTLEAEGTGGGRQKPRPADLTGITLVERQANAEEKDRHREFVKAKLGDNALWLKVPSAE